MGKKLPYTPNSVLKNALRTVWMRSRERNNALRRTGRRCSYCQKKASVAKGKEVKLYVHHRKSPNWQRIFDVIREELLPTEWDALIPACKECDFEQHHPENRPKKPDRSF